MTKKKGSHLEIENLKKTELQQLKTEETKAEDKKTENRKKQCLATLKRLKRDDDNE